MSKKKKRRRKHRLSKRARFYIFNIILGIIILLVISFMLIYFLCKVKKVNVTGNTITGSEVIETEVLNDKYSENAVYVLLKSKFKFLRTKDIPFVKDYKISLTDRNTVLITVEEEMLFGYIPQADGSYAYFDENGIVVEISNLAVEGVMPLSGIECEAAEVGEQLPIDSDQLNLILTLTKNLKKNDLTTGGIFFDESGNLFMVYNTVFINYGDGSELAAKVMRLPYILPKLDGMIGILHLEKFSLEETDIVFEKL